MRNSVKPFSIVAAVLLLSASVLAAEPDAASADPVQASLLADTDAAVPGGTVTLGVLLRVKPHWHTYWINPGETGNPTQFHFHGPAGVEFGPVGWPLPSKIDADGAVVYGYEREVLFLVPVKIATDLAGARSVKLQADVSWLSCRDTCIEGSAKLTIDLPISANPKPVNATLFENWKQRLAISKDQALALGALSDIVQQSGSDGSPAAVISVHWKTAPRKVEWFPVSNESVVIENVAVSAAKEDQQITFKVTVYKPDDVPGGRVDSLLVYEDAAGRRVGVSFPIKVKLVK